MPVVSVVTQGFLAGGKVIANTSVPKGREEATILINTVGQKGEYSGQANLL